MNKQTQLHTAIAHSRFPSSYAVAVTSCPARVELSSQVANYSSDCRTQLGGIVSLEAGMMVVHRPRPGSEHGGSPEDLAACEPPGYEDTALA